MERVPVYETVDTSSTLVLRTTKFCLKGFIATSINPQAVLYTVGENRMIFLYFFLAFFT